MPFVNELVPDADKSRFVGIRYPAYGDPVRPYKWTIDRDRNAFLLPTRLGGPDSPGEGYFLMGWRDHLIRLVLKRNVIGNVQDGLTYTWSIRDMDIPDVLQGERAAILQDLKEALATYGNVFQRENIHTVQFDF